jgi:hypothetical protein
MLSNRQTLSSPHRIVFELSEGGKGMACEALNARLNARSASSDYCPTQKAFTI